MKTRILLLTVLSVVIISCNPSEDQIHFIIKNKIVASIDDRLFGQFLEKPSWEGEWGPEAALKPGTRELQDGVMELMKEMNIPVLRFPGGTDVDFINWMDLVDNIPGCKGGRPFFIGHQGDTVTTDFGYDEAGKLAEKLGAELLLVVNFGDAYFHRKTRTEAAWHEARMLAYCAADTGIDLPGDLEKWPQLRARNGHPEPYPVRYIQIANEPFVLDRENLKQRGTIPQKAKENYFSCLETYINTFKTVLPQIEIIVDGNCEELTNPLKENFGDKISYVAYHSYMPWSVKFFLKDGKKIRPDSLTIQDIWKGWITSPGINTSGLSAFSDSGLGIAENSGYPVAVTEWNWNGWWGVNTVDPDRSGSLFTKGMGAAGYLHAMMRNGNNIAMGIQSMLVGNSWGITAIRVSPEGGYSPYPMPTGQVTGLYSNYHGNHLLDIETGNNEYYAQPYAINAIHPADSVAVIDAIATKTEKKLFFHAINRDFISGKDIQIDISDIREGSFSAILHSLSGNFSNLKPCNTDPLRYACISDTILIVNKGILNCILPPRSVNIIDFSLE